MNIPAKDNAAIQDDQDTPNDNLGYDEDDSAANSKEEEDSQAAETKTFAEKVEETLDNVTSDEKGNLVFPEGTSDEIKYAVTAEKRHRDTKSAYTKSQQKLKALEKEKAALRSEAVNAVNLELTLEQVEELDELKESDPDAWRRKLNAYEQDAIKAREKQLDDEMAELSNSTLEEEELASRKEQLAAWQEKHPDVKLDDDVIANDIPPRLTKQLNDGAIDFPQFLNKCHKYLTTGKVIHDTKVSNEPNLSKVGGGDKPDANAQKEDIITSYSTETY